MDQAKEFHNLDDTADGLFRELCSGVTTRIFSGEQAMLSVVSMAPNAQGILHHHPEEQWGVLLEGSAVRVQDGQEIPVKKGDFWRTPGNVPHTMRAGPEGARVLDVFRYRKPGSGFAGR
jgi:quercetin dioxygenase-like cupin family protein